MNLYIIGNGFDLSHKIESSYSSFRTFLERKTIPLSDDFCESNVCGFLSGFREFETLSSLMILKEMISQETPDWNSFEEALGILDFDNYILDLIICESQISIKNKLVQSCLSVSDELKCAFNEWVKQIDINRKPKSEFKKMLTQDDLFLSFNYTCTLEKLYLISPKSIYHIHGKSGGNLIFGHGNRIDRDVTNDYEYYHSELLASLRKPVEDAWSQFMESDMYHRMQNNINDIYVYGFSFSKVDRYYIERIVKLINREDIYFKFNDYDIDKIDEYKSFLISNCSFEGQFDTFHIG